MFKKLIANGHMYNFLKDYIEERKMMIETIIMESEEAEYLDLSIPLETFSPKLLERIFYPFNSQSYTIGKFHVEISTHMEDLLIVITYK